MFLKLKKLMGQSDLQEDERKENEVVESVSQPRVVGEKVNAPEYLQVLLKEHEPVRLLAHITELVNSNVPEFLRKCIDKEAEKSHIYEHLSASFNEYIGFVVGKVYADTNDEAVAAVAAVELQVSALTDRIREIDREKNEIQKLQLSSERQKRTYSERVHELEARITQFENEKSTLEEERRGLRDRVKKAEEQESVLRTNIEQLRTEQAVWQEKAAGYDQCVAGYTARENELRQIVETITQAGQEAEIALHAAQDREQDLQAKLTGLENERELQASQVNELTGQMSALQLRLEELQSQHEAGVSELVVTQEALKAALEREQFLQELQSENEETQAKQLKQIQGLNALSEEMRTQIQNSTNERQNALDACLEAENRLKGILENETALKDEVKLQNEQREIAQQQIQQLSDQLRDVQVDLQKVKEEAALLQQNSDERATALMQSQTSENELKQALDKKEAEREVLKQQLLSLESQLKEASRLSESFEAGEKRQKEQAENAVRDLEAVRENETVLKKQLEDLEAARTVLEQQVADLTAEQQTHQQQWSEAEAAWQAVTEREQAMQASLKAAKAERAELAATLDVLRQDREKAGEDQQTRLKEALEQAEIASQKLGQVEAEQEKLTARLEQSERNCADLINRMATQNASFESSQRERSDVDKEVKAKLETDLEALTESFNNLEKQLTEERAAKVALETKLKEKEQVSAKKTDEESGVVQELKHELLVTNDMLTALKNQRQSLLSDLEKAHNEQQNLRQYVAGLEESVKQYDETVKGYEKEIEGLKTSEVSDTNVVTTVKTTKKTTRKEAPVQDTDNWLQPTQPDTPEIIARRKAEKKVKEQQEQEESQKQDIKPDLSQMSLW